MKLNMIHAPYGTHRVITYNREGNKAIYRYIPMRHFFGNIYAGEPMLAPYGIERVPVYAWFEEPGIGIAVNTFDADCDDEAIAKAVNSLGLNSPDNFLAYADAVIAANAWLKLPEVELLAILCPEKVPAAMEARRVHRERLEAKRAEIERREQEEDEAYVVERNAEAEATVANALKVLREGGRLTNCEVTTYKTRYNSTDTRVVIVLMDRLGIVAPPTTRHWIKDTLTAFDVGAEGRATRYYYNKGKGSDAAWKVLNALIDAARREEVA